MRNAYFSLLNNLKDLNCGYVRKVCDALHYIFDYTFIRFDSQLYRQIVGIPMGTNCAPLAALFLFCYERDFILSLFDNNQADAVEAFNSTSIYLDGLLNIDYLYFAQLVSQIYPTELQLNNANSSNAEAPFLELELSITNGIISAKIYDKRDDFNFEIINADIYICFKGQVSICNHWNTGLEGTFDLSAIYESNKDNVVVVFFFFKIMNMANLEGIRLLPQ